MDLLDVAWFILIAIVVIGISCRIKLDEISITLKRMQNLAEQRTFPERYGLNDIYGRHNDTED